MLSRPDEMDDEPYNLLVDVGNTFVKWGRYRDTPQAPAIKSCLDYGHALLDEMGSLAFILRRFPAPRHIVISNVAGTRMRSLLLRVLEIWNDAPAPYWLIPREEQCGVKNGYRNPAQLGSDRWAALIGARAIVGGKSTVVVSCGTATTIDLLTADGRFAGGVILPGVGLMVRALHQNTASLPDADGEYVENPLQTVDAIVTGCQHAQAGAIERVFHLHSAKHPGLHCLLSGGAGGAIAQRLTIPFQHRDNLVLEGLHRISQTLDSP